MLSYCSSRLAGLSIDPVPAFSVKCAFLPQLVRLEIQYKRETITLFLSFLRKNYSTDVLQQNFHTLSRLFYDIWLSHFIFPVLKENLRKQKVPVYNLSSYFLHLFFFLQTDKTFFDKKKKKKWIGPMHTVKNHCTPQTGNAPEAAAGTQENKHSSWQWPRKWFNTM